MRMRRNLFLGLASIVAIAAALTVLTYRNLSATNESLRNLYEIESDVQADLKILRANQSADRQDALAMMFDPDSLQQRGRLHALASRAAQTEACVERLLRRMQDFPRAYRRFQCVVDLRRSFVETRDQRLVPLILGGRQGEAKEIILGIQRQRSEQMSEAMDKLTNDVNAAFQERLSGMRRSTAGMLHLLVGLTGIGLTLSTAILFFIHKTLRTLEQAENGLKLRNAVLTVQQETSLDDIMVVDPSGAVTFYNRRHADLWDVAPETLGTQPFSEAIQPLLHKLADPGAFLRKIDHLSEDKGEESRDEIALNDGRVFDRYTAPLVGADHCHYGRIWYLRDITERKQAEKEISQNWRLLQSIIDTSTAVIYVKDREGRFLLINSRFEELFHVTRSWIVGRTDYDVFPADRAAAFRSFDQQVQATGRTLESEEVVPQDDGLHTYLSIKAPLYDEEGRLQGICGISTDISEWKRAEQEHLSHLRFLESLEKVDRAIREAESLDAMMTGVLDSALSIFGSDRAWLLYPCDPGADSFRVPMERTNSRYPGALIMGRELPVTAEVREAFEAALGECDPQVYDSRSGRSLPPEVSRHFQVRSQIMVALYPKRGKPWLFGMHQCSHPRIWEEQDATLFKEISRRIADGLSSLLFLREMQDSREKLRATLASMDDLVLALDQEGRVIDYFHPPDKPDPYASSAALLGKSLREALPPESAKPLEKAMAAVTRSGAVQQVEYPVALGEEERWFYAKASARKDAAGNFAGVTIVARDVSEIKLAQEGLRKLSQELEERVRQRTSQLEAANSELVQLAGRLETAYEAQRQETEERLKMMEELREKERMLIQQSHLAGMGELISSIAHHWRQPLNVLGLIVQEISFGQGTMPSDYLKEHSAKAMQVINALSKTINDFSYFFRSNEEKGFFSLKDVLVKATALLEVALREQHVRLELNIEDEDAVIEGYQRDYFQVLLNIMTNAKDACWERKVGEPRIVLRQYRENGHTVVTVADNAGGIPEAVMERIFEPYFTTKGPDKRAGIGLYMAKTVIEKSMNGSLTVRNTSDGAEFRIEV